MSRMWGSWRLVGAATCWRSCPPCRRRRRAARRHRSRVDALERPTREGAAAIGQEAGGYQLIDARLDYPSSWRVAQATGAPGVPTTDAGKAPGANEPSASELNKQLSNPVTEPLVARASSSTTSVSRTASGTTTCSSSRCCRSGSPRS